MEKDKDIRIIDLEYDILHAKNAMKYIEYNDTFHLKEGLGINTFFVVKIKLTDELRNIIYKQLSENLIMYEKLRNELLNS